MKKLERLVLPAVLACALAACGGAETPEELAEVVFSLLQEGDYAAYVEDAVATPSQVIEVCPAKTEYVLDQAKHQDHFDACMRRFNFASADISKVEPKYNTTAGCGQSVASIEEIAITVVNDAEILTFKIKGALETADGWRATDVLDCPGK